MSKSKPVIIIGGGGHAAVLADILIAQHIEIIAFVSPDNNAKRSVFKDIKQMYQDDDVLAFKPNEVDLINGIGAMPESTLRFTLYKFYHDNGYSFRRVISDNAVISPFAIISEGAQIMHGCIIQTGAVIGENTIINTGVIIEHDCIINAHSHIAPRAVICGNSEISHQVFIGAGATVIQNINIGALSIIAAGAIVNKHVLAKQCVYGARAVIKHSFVI